MVDLLRQFAVHFASLWLFAAMFCGPAVLPGATPYQWGTKLRLANGAESLLVVHAKDGVEQGFSARVQLPLRGATYQKVTIWGTKYRSAKSESTCPVPCELALPLHYGSPKLYAEYFDTNGNKLRESEWYDVPQAAATPSSSFTMPLEVIGFAPYRLPVSVSAQPNANLTGTIRLYAKTHRLTYPGKGRVRVNGGAWLNIQRANVTLLDHARGYNFASSMDFSQDVLWWTMNLPSSTVRSGANIVEWEYAKEQKEQSGYRVLEFNFLEPDKTVTQVSLAGTTATLTIPAHGYSTGDDVLIDNFPGIAWRINRTHRNISVTGPDTFTFSVPNPKSLSGTWTYSGVRVSRLIVDADSFVNENPATWTTPVGASAAAGQSAFNATSLRATDFPGEFITASCASCHAKDGRDLKYFAFSNRSIEVRGQFHGLSVQQSQDIAAYIRAHSSTVPGRAWYSPYQPCPAADTASAYDWSGSCSPDEVLPNEMGMMEQLAANGASMTVSDWDENRSDLTFRNARISFQFPSIFEWWPTTHPQDVYVGANCGVYANGCFATSQPLTAYNQIYEDLGPYCPGTGTQCQNRIAGLGADGRRNFQPKYLSSFRSLNGQSPFCVGSPADTDCFSQPATLQNQYLPRIYSVGQWGLMKAWEINHALNLEQYGLTWYTQGGVENPRIAPYGAYFSSSPNLMRARLDNAMVGILDGTGATEKLVSMQWYHLQGAVLSNKNKCCPGPGFDAIQPIDVPYTWGYFLDLAADEAKVYLPLTQVLWSQQQFIRYQGATPANGPGFEWYPNAINAYRFGTQTNSSKNWLALPSADRATLRANVLLTGLEKYTSLFCGEEANGTSPAFTVSNWRALGNAEYQSSSLIVYPTLFEVGGLNLASGFAHGLVYGSALGISSGLRTRMATCGNAMWPGPTATLSGGIDGSQTTIPITGSWGWADWPEGVHRVQIDGEIIRCASRSGNTLSGCTRGSDNTTPVLHSNGATVRKINRWNSLASVSCAMGGDGVTIDCSGAGIEP